VSTEDTPFSLVYGTEAVIPVKIGMPTDERQIDLDLLEERRECTAICGAKAKSKMKGYYDAKSDSAPKQTLGTTNSVFTMMGPLLGTTQATTTTTSTADLQRAPFTTPHQTVLEIDSTEPPPALLRYKGSDLEVDNLALKGVAPELAPSDFVSQNYETLATLMQEETKKRSSHSLQARLNFDPEDEASLLRHRKERRERDSRRPPVFTIIGKKVVGDQTPDLQDLGTHENNGWRTNDSRRKCRKRVSSSSSDSSDNEDEETEHWKSRNRYRNQEDEDMSRPWRRQKVDMFTRRISDFSEDKRRRMHANVKTYDGTSDPDDHLKIFKSAATIKNWPQPVWCHMFNSTLVGNAQNWFKLIKRLNDRVPQTFDELMKRTRSFIEGEAAAATQKM
nr:reverse transcriptase domain-containing protein [Tanacetum cinerariifolium]